MQDYFEDDEEDAGEALAISIQRKDDGGNQHFGPKRAPHFEGQISWWTFEERVRDWQDICTLTKEQQGPNL